MKQKQVIFVPKLMEPLTVADLANKVVKFRPGADPRFVLHQKKYDPTYYPSVESFPYRKFVKIRILTEYPLAVDFGKNSCCVPKRPKTNPDIKTILVHIHGGGFVGLTSRTHQNYLRKWTKMLSNCLIMSIDYRLAPQFAFPAAVDDIWQGYYWIITQCEEQLGTLIISYQNA